MSKYRSFALSVLLLAFVAISGQAFATTFAVGSCTAHTSYATIQLAVTTVPAGSTVQICPGTYHEQVVISKKLTLTGVASANQNSVVILPPAGGLIKNTTGLASGDPIAAQVLVKNTVGPVNLTGFTVNGTGNGLPCGPDVQGVRFENASGTVNNVPVHHQIPNDIPNGCQVGQGIFVESGPPFLAYVTIQSSPVHDYNKNGITAHGSGTTVEVVGNTVLGSGVVPVPGAAQNGIEIAFGAKGKVIGNVVTDNIYGDPNVAASADILLYDGAEYDGYTVNTDVEDNDVGKSQLPIAIYTDFAYGPSQYGDGVRVVGNRITTTLAYDAIDSCTNNNVFEGNQIFNSAESAIHLDASCGEFFGGPATGNHNSVIGNTVVESACAGILEDPGTTGNGSLAFLSSNNTFFSVPFNVTASTASCPSPATALAGSNLAQERTVRKVSPAAR